MTLLNNLNYNKQDYSNLGYYLAGLIEGDGFIITPKQERDLKNRLCCPSILLSFNLRDLPLALVIQQKLGFGSLVRQKGSKTYRLIINNYEELLVLVFLLNGKMKTPKIIDLWILIDWLNLKFLNLKLPKFSLNDEYILNNPWFSGFIDASGSFSIKTTNNHLGKKKIECKFIIVQCRKDHNSNDKIDFLDEIAKVLLTTVKFIRNNKPKLEYSVRTVNLLGNLKLKYYLEKYPLFSSKYLDYKDWLKILKLFEKGRITHNYYFNYAFDIKSNVNDKRKTFIWNFLQNFYSLER